MQFGIVPLLLAAHLTSQAQNNFEWKDASGKTRNRSDLEEILGKHNEWLRSGGKSGVRANLNRAILSGANLNRANLSYAELFYTDLNGADLSGADLSGADLNSANLSRADLSGADLGDSAYVDRALFEPKSLPALRGIAAARGLELLTYRENPDSLSTPQAISRRRLPGSGTGDYVRTETRRGRGGLRHMYVVGRSHCVDFGQLRLVRFQ